MDIRPMLPDLVLRQLAEGDREGTARSIRSGLNQGDGVRHILAGMARFTGHHAPGTGAIHASVVIDGVRDLVPTWGATHPDGLLSAAAEYLLALPSAAPPLERFDPVPEEPSAETIPIASLEEALSEGDLDRALRAMDGLARVIQSHEYFLEILLEAVSPEATPQGRLLIQTAAAVKLLHELDWESGRAIAYRLAEALCRASILPGPQVIGSLPPVPCRAGYLASLDHDHPEDLWLYLSHAFQAARYVQLRPRDLPWGLRAWIASHLFDGDEAMMDAAEDELGPRPPRHPGEVLPEPPVETGRRIARGIAHGSPRDVNEAADWAQRLPDVDPLYRWIAEGTTAALERGNPRPILAVNAARWGAHLLGPLGSGSITERLIERLPALMA